MFLTRKQLIFRFLYRTLFAIDAMLLIGCFYTVIAIIFFASN